MRSPVDGEDFATKLDVLNRLKDLHVKKNDIVASLAKKYYGVDELEDSKVVFGGYGAKGEAK